jgi:hypothetical protein
MENINLIPNQSLGAFMLGDTIEKYKHIPHDIIHHEGEGYCYDSYDFYDLGVVLWLDNNEKINTIRCTKYCYWKEKNLIKMPFEQFLFEYGVKPDKSEILYTLISENKGQNQKVYTFDDLGLMIWVWREKIKTILISNYQVYEGKN